MNFDDIRPYTQEEIPAAMQRISADPLFPTLSGFVFPGKPVAEVKTLLAGLKTTEDFQGKVMNPFNREIIRRSITDFTFSGLENVKRDVPYLFVSNHRDIVLDSSLLQNVLYENHYQTTEITFGANLMQGQLIVDIGKSNKMFRVERGGTPKEFYLHSKHLSDYIRHVITQKHHGVWIAQRNGRTKDGMDRTEPGIIKMFSLSGPSDKVENLSALNILPVSVSYEWESCDMYKAFELYLTQKDGTYSKEKGEDVKSILTGILQPKGRVHFEFCEPLTTSELSAYGDCTQNEYHQKVASLIDRRICRSFRLWPNNYIAHDLLHGKGEYAQRYTDAERRAFDLHVQDMLDEAAMRLGADFDRSLLVEIFLKIYANPVDNRIAHS